jgi:predicted metal-dependent peptidase
MTHSARARAALIRLAEADPAIGALALWVDHRDSDARDLAAWTDGRTIFYGAPFADLAPHEAAGLAAHHVLHAAFRHPARARAMAGRFGGAFAPDLFALACDAILNQTLTLAGHALPRPAVLLSDLLAEALPEERQVTAWDAEALYLRLCSAAPGRAGDRGTDGRARAYAERQGFRPDLEPGQGAGGAGEDALADADWHDRLARALAVGRAAGRGIGALGETLLDLPRPVVPWERHLRRLLARALTEDARPDAARPARRWIAAEADARARGRPEPAYEGARRRPVARARIAACIDTSTSVDDATLALFAAQIADIGRRSGAEVHVLAFDTAVTQHAVMSGTQWEGTIARLPFARGGGTDFAPVLAAAAALAPSAIVVLTDLDAPAPPEPGRIPVIWAVPVQPAPPAPFGRVLSLVR